MPEIQSLQQLQDSLQELSQQPLKLSEYQLAILTARLRNIQQEKLDYHPDFSTEELIRKAIRNLAHIDGALEFITDLIEESTNHNVEEEE